MFNTSLATDYVVLHSFTVLNCTVIKQIQNIMMMGFVLLCALTQFKMNTTLSVVSPRFNTWYCFVSFPVALQFLLGVWAKDLNRREDHVKRSVQGKLASATHSQTESYLKPLFRKLRKKVTFSERTEKLQGKQISSFFNGYTFSIISFRIYQLTSKNQLPTSLNSCWRENMSRYVII